MYPLTLVSTEALWSSWGACMLPVLQGGRSIQPHTDLSLDGLEVEGERLGVRVVRRDVRGSLCLIFASAIDASRSGHSFALCPWRPHSWQMTFDLAPSAFAAALSLSLSTIDDGSFAPNA